MIQNEDVLMTDSPLKELDINQNYTNQKTHRRRVIDEKFKKSSSQSEKISKKRDMKYEYKVMNNPEEITKLHDKMQSKMCLGLATNDQINVIFGIQNTQNFILETNPS